MNRPRSFWPALVIVAIVAAIGGWVRYLIAADELLWLDELHTSWTVAGELGDVYQRSLSGNQTPLFFWLSWASVQLFGETELSIRLVSLIAGITTILAAGWLVLRWTGSTIAAVATSILIAFDVQFIYYATEARPYSLIQFLSIVQAALFWRLISSERSPTTIEAPVHASDSDSEKSNNHQATGREPIGWFGLSLLSLTTALLFYAHYTSAWLLIAEVCFVGALLVAKYDFRRRNLKRVLVATAVTALLLVPAAPQLMQIMERRTNWSSVSSIGELLTQQVMSIGVWVLIPAVVLGIAFAAGVRANRSENEKVDQNRRLCFVFLWAILPTAGVVALDYFQLAPMALARYTLVGAVAMPVFAGMAIGFAGHRKVRNLLAIGMIALSLVLSPVTSGKFVTSGFDAGELPGLRWEDWRTPIETINANQPKQNHPVLLAANLIEDAAAFKNSEARFQEYLSFPVRGIHQVLPTLLPTPKEGTSQRAIIPIPTMPSEHLRDSEIEKIKNSGGAWLIVRGTRELAVEIEDEIIGKSAALFPKSGGIQTTRFEVPHSHVYLISFDW